MSNFITASNAITTSGTTLYTCPANTTSMVHTLYITNVSTTTSGNVTISHSTASGNNKATGVSGATNYRVAFNIPILKNNTFFYDKPIVLNAGDSLILTASANSLYEAELCMLLL